jgi:hypothetical protein
MGERPASLLHDVSYRRLCHSRHGRPPAESPGGGSIGGADINMVPRRRRYKDAFSPTAVEVLLL